MSGFVLRFCYGLSVEAAPAVLVFVLVAHAECHVLLATVESAFKPITPRVKLTLDAAPGTPLKRPFSES